MSNKLGRIKLFVDDKEKLKGRLVGIVSDEECRAILNTEGAAKKIFTSEGIDPEGVNGSMYGKRFVIACEDRTIFISPKFKCLSWSSKQKYLRCADKKAYRMEPDK